MKKKYRCDICDKEFSSKKGLLIHKGKTHKKDDKTVVIDKKILFLISILLLVLISGLIYHKTMRDLNKKEIETEEPKTPSDQVLYIKSPLNKTYYDGNIPLEVISREIPNWIVNSFDGGRNITECRKCLSYIRRDISFDHGTHTIRVYAEYGSGTVKGDEVTFIVKT